MIIDCHAHITGSGGWFHTAHDSSLNNLLRKMDLACIDKSIVLPIQGTISNIEVLNACQQYPDRLIGFGSIKMVDDVKFIKKQVEEIAKMGLVGIKIHPRLQEISLKNPLIDAILQEVTKYSLITLFCGYQQCSSLKVLLDDLAPYNYDRLAKNHPEAKIIIAHMGGHRVLDAYFVAKSNPNVFLDTSYVFKAMKGSSVYKDLIFVLRNLDKKVIFGTDFPEIDPIKYLRLMQSEMEKYEDCESELILSKNIQSLLK